MGCVASLRQDRVAAVNAVDGRDQPVVGHGVGLAVHDPDADADIAVLGVDAAASATHHDGVFAIDGNDDVPVLGIVVRRALREDAGRSEATQRHVDRAVILRYEDLSRQDRTVDGHVHIAGGAGVTAIGRAGGALCEYAGGAVAGGDDRPGQVDIDLARIADIALAAQLPAEQAENRNVVAELAHHAAAAADALGENARGAAAMRLDQAVDIDIDRSAVATAAGIAAECQTDADVEGRKVAGPTSVLLANRRSTLPATPPPPPTLCANTP